MEPVISQQRSKETQGLTLTELLIAAAVGLITASAAGELLISQLRNSERAEALERQRSDWNRTASFLEAEIALSQRVFDDPNQITIPANCNISDSEFRLGLDQSRALDPVIFGVKTSGSGWLGSHSLIRCGPSFDSLGGPISNASLSVAVLLDGLDGNQPDNGFTATASSNSKKASFTIYLQGHATNRTYQQSDSARTRINPYQSRPSENKLCVADNYIRLEGTEEADVLEMGIGEVLEGEDILICGRGGDDTITGSDQANDILEASGSGNVSLTGMSGDDVLRGAEGNDTLSGGEGNDELIGGNGDDSLNGGAGNNRYLPGLGNDTIQGSSGLDLVFYPGNQSSYTLNGNCSQSSCTISGASGTDVLSNVETIIFDDSRIDLP